MSSTQRLRRSFVTVTAAALVVAACGSEESAGGSIEEWCEYAAEAEAVDGVFDGFSAGGDVETGVGEIRPLVERLDDVAPAEIAEDAGVLQEGTLQLLSALEDADFDILDADFSFMAEDDLEARLDAASDNLDAFSERECGRPFGSGDDSDSTSDDDDSFDPAAGTLRDQLLAQFESIGLTAEESGCVADNLDFSDPAIQDGDTTAIFEVFSTCDIDLDRLAEIGGG